ncbi:hypothetical protein Dimus_008301 [Dionaea muscipula]
MERLGTTFPARLPSKSKRKRSSVSPTNTGTSSFNYLVKSSFSGNTDNKATFDQPVAINLEHTHLDYHGDGTSCVSEGNGPNMIVGYCSGEADRKPLSSSSASVNSSFPADFGKSIDIQSANKFSSSDHGTAKEGEICSSTPLTCSSETLQLAEDLPDRSDPSETSSYRTEQPGSILTKCQRVHCSSEQADALLAGPANFVADGPQCDTHTSADSVKISTVKNDGDQFAADASKDYECHEHSEFIEALSIPNKEPSSFSRAIDDGDGSEELVDVRVCDICGDVGREALLAVCSRCGDGAEHIYCMRIKLDKPPEGDWICEECATAKQQLESQAVAGKSSGLTKQPSFNEEQQGSGEIELGIRNAGSRKQPCIKRHGCNLQVPDLKRSLRRSLSCTMMNRGLQKTASLKSLTSGEYTSHFSSPVFKNSDKEGRSSSHSVSRSFRDGQQAAERPFLKRSYSSMGNYAAPTSPRSSSGISLNDSKKTIALPRYTKFKLDPVPKATSCEKRTAEFHKTPNVVKFAGCIDHKASNSGNISAGATRQLTSSSDRCNFVCSPVGTDSLPDRLKAKQSLEGSSLEPASRAAACSMKSADKAHLETSPSVKNMSSSGVLPLSAVPEPDYIWKGVFKIEKGGKLPSYCDGIQTHLSASASPKVPEVVLKFPLEIHLLGVPRSDAWPVQFQKNGVSEDYIALFFFAEDHHSYCRMYKRLLECMIANDMALVADLNGVELLIFPSNVLPQRSQRWNNLPYLWGVFRGTKTKSPHYLPLPSDHKMGCIPNLNIEATMQNLSVSAKMVFPASMGGNASSSTTLHQSIQVGDVQSASLITCASTSHKPDVCRMMPEHLFSQNVGGSIPAVADLLLASPPDKQLQLLGDMEPSEDLQKEDECRMRCLEGKLEGNTDLFDQPNINESSQSGNPSFYYCRPCQRVSDLDNTFYPMIDPSPNEMIDRVKRSTISFIPLACDPSPPSDSIDLYKSAEGQTDPMDSYPNLDLCLGNMMISLKQDHPAWSLDPSNRDAFQFHHPHVDVDLSLGLPSSSHKVMWEFFPKVGLPDNKPR